MGVNLDGLENVPREERQVLSQEKFYEYIKSVERTYSESINYYIISEAIRRGKANFESIYQEYVISTKEELAEILEKEVGFNILTYDLKELIKNVPEEIISQIGDLDSIIDSIHDYDDYEKISDEIDFSNVDELFTKRLIDIATEVSKCDLSQITQESYARAKFLRYINFQNTGAKLDFEYIKQNREDYKIYISSENLKGTELISFDIDLYNRTEEETPKEEWPSFIKTIQLNPENFDVSQYQTVIDSYNIANKWINNEVGLFLVNQELQKNSKWLIDYAFANIKQGIFLAENIWSQLTKESQIENKNCFKSILDYIKDSENTYLWSSVFKTTAPEIMDENSEDINKIFTNDEGILQDSFFYVAFPYFSNNYKEQMYKDSEDLPFEKRALILSKTNPQYINDNFIELFDGLINSPETNVGRFFYTNKLMQHFTSHEFDVANMEHFMEVIKEASINSEYDYSTAISNIFAYLNCKNQIDYYKKIMQIGIDNNIPEKNIARVFESMDSHVKEENFIDILEFSQTLSPKIAHYIRGSGYIRMVQNMPDKKRAEFIEKNYKDILLSLRTKFTDSEVGFEDTLSSYEREKFDSNYSGKFVAILLAMDKKGELNSDNINIVIDNLPKLGEDTISRLYNSNSDMIRANSSQLITSVSALGREDAIALIEDTERLFSKDTIPDFVKLYKFYENVVERQKHVLSNAINKKENYSPELQQAGSEEAGKRIIFSDLLNISLKSNNKSLKKFIGLLEKGNEIYVKYLNNGKDLSSLTDEEKDTLRKYSETLYTIYDESLVSKYDKKDPRRRIKNSKDYMKTLEDLTKRYIGNAFPKDLSNEVIKTVIGRYDELIAGRRTIEDFKKYMRDVNIESNKRHARLEKTKLTLEPGDLIKGVQNANNFLQDLFSNGIRAGEFLGTDTHTDATPLDSDHSIILPNNVGESLRDTISRTSSNLYGSFYLVIKKDEQKIKYTRNDPEYTFKSEKAPEYQSKLGKNADREAIKARINNRINGSFEEPKLEAFSSYVTGIDHYGIRTGMSITDVDYIVVSNYDKRIGYELAMNGTFIPVVDMSTNEVVFGTQDYKKIREQMQGLSYFGTKRFEVEQSAYNLQVEKKVEQLFPDGDVRESISEKDARVKREIIERKVRESILEKLGLGFESKITGDITPGFIEFIDTGSTGRGTNLPGDGDFDFSVKIDKSIFDNSKKMDEFRRVLKDVLAIPSNHEECKLDEFNGNFRYKKVQIEGAPIPLDIDITFMQKSEDVTYSTDMAVKDRLQGLKQNDPEGYKRVIANIVIAKEMLKKEGIYKKKSSDGATLEGGFGGVGVENWILQNGGSFVKAMQTFLDASEKAESFNEFMDIYPIFDFGQNHMAKGYQHDSFIKGLSEFGYKKMQEKFKEFIEELAPNQVQEITMKDLARNALKQGIRTEEFNEAYRSIAQEELQLDTDKDFIGGE